MECKANTELFVPEKMTVLIETLWNVKSGVFLLCSDLGRVLIETLWNVKEPDMPDWF